MITLALVHLVITILGILSCAYILFSQRYLTGSWQILITVGGTAITFLCLYQIQDNFYIVMANALQLGILISYHYTYIRPYTLRCNALAEESECTESDNAERTSKHCHIVPSKAALRNVISKKGAKK